jgi:hypothetical protein
VGYNDAEVKDMNSVLEAEKYLSSLTRAEKAQVLQWIVRD